MSFARLTSFGDLTAVAARSRFEDEDFKINPNKGIIVRTPDFRLRTAELSNFPVLAGVDVQTQITRVTVRSGKGVITHFHPRGLEVLNALRGVFKITFVFEGLNPRKVTNIIKAGESTVFPQGLVHETVCVSKKDCMFLSIFNTADPGLVPTSPIQS